MLADEPMPAPPVSDYICPACGHTLRADPDRKTCTGCSAIYPVRGNINVFLDSSYYWGELQESRLALLNQEAEEIGWRAAVTASFEETDPVRFNSIANPARTNSLSLVRVPRQDAALDVGCGMGIHTVALAQSFKKVYALDAVRERLRFTSIRVAQENLHNVELLQASVAQVPLRDESLDLILMNGILEWIGEWIHNASPRDAQLQVLSALCRKLRPAGQLLIGIENRFSYSFLAGGADHSGIPFTSLLPRWMADLATYFWGRKEYRHQPREFLFRTYRTYTYSYLGYRRLLREAGFGEVQFFYCWPGYNLPSLICPLEDHPALERSVRGHLLPNTPRKRLERALALLAIRSRGWKLIAPSFLILCRR